MYTAEGDKVFIEQEGKKEHFLTVHPTDTSGTMTPEEQAEVLARVLNDLVP